MLAILTPQSPPTSHALSPQHAQMLSPQSSLSPTLTPAAPPTRSEIERKLSFKSAAKGGGSPKKKRVASGGPGPGPSGTDSDSSLNPSSPILGPTGGSVPMLSGLSAASSKAPLTVIAERKGGGIGSGEDEIYEDEEEGGEDDGSGSDGEAAPKEGGEELKRGMEGERVLKSGYLWKKQEKRKVWKKKWFVLRTGKLAYYKDDKEYSLSKVIDLRQVHTVAAVTVKKQSFTFGIVTTKRTFLARASSQDEMDVWVNAINAALRYLKGGGDPQSAPQSQSNPAPMQIAIPGRNDGSALAFSPSSMSSASTIQPASGGFMGRSPAMQSPVMETLDSRLAKMSLPSTAASSPGTATGPAAMQQSSLGRGTGPRAISQARREPSASSLASSSATGDYFPRQPSTNITNQALSPVQPSILSSDDEEQENDQAFTNPMLALGSGAMPMTNVSYPHVSGPVDPKKVILSSYLMKRSKGRGRKLWRKRWFFLTSQGLTYTKSHMDGKPLRYIPLSSILDALDLPTPGGSSSDPDSEDDARPHRTTSTSSHGHGYGQPFASDRSPPQRQLSHLGTSLQSSLGGMSYMGRKDRVDEEHIFRLVTAKRTYVLCAPSEEDEIKWLAAFRALLQRERAGPSSPLTETAPRLPAVTVPTITQQPPTPALSVSSMGADARAIGLDTESIRSTGGSQGSHGGSQGGHSPTTRESPHASFGLRGRSATYTAKSAVADVVRRFHPEQHPQGQAA